MFPWKQANSAMSTMSSPGLSSSPLSSLGDFSREESDVNAKNDDGHYDEDNDVTVARPPRRATTSAEAVLSGQAALDVLDQLQRSGQIGRERASNLRRRYYLLKEALEGSRASETSLLAQVKQFGQVLTQQQQVLERGEGFPDGESGEASRLRQILLSHSNQLEQSQQQLTTLNNQLSSLEEEHGQVSRELDRLPRQADVDARLQDLNRQLDDLRDEIRKRSKDIQHYNGELASRGHRLSSIVKNTEELNTMEGALQNELIAIRAAPSNLPREIDSIHKRIRDTKQQMKDSDSHLQNITVQLEELQNHHKTLQEELRSANLSLVGAREEGSRLHDLERQAGSSLDQAKERQVALLEQQASLELGSRHRAKEQRRLYEVSATLTRDKDRTAKQLKKAELHLEAAKQGEAPLQQRSQSLQMQVDEGRVAARERQKRQEDIQLEVDTLRKGLIMQESVSSAQLAVLEDKQHEEARAHARLTALSNRLHDLNKEAVALARMRDKDSRTCRQARLSEVETQASLYTQEVQLREQTKALAQLEQQLKDFAEAYKLIKTERNHTHSHIQKLRQLACEMKEKWRVLENEAEVLTSSARDKEKLMQRCNLVLSSKSMERDSERQAASQLALESAQNSADLEAQRETLAKLTHEVSSLDHQLNQLRKKYEQALQERNDAGLQLIERNEEVCVFHERLNMQEAVLRDAALDLMTREEEIRYLHMELSQLQNHILVCRKGLPEQSRLQAELDAAQTQLCVCEEELRRLEAKVEDAQDPTRLRLLGGPQSSQDDLGRHLEVLEERLAAQEQAGLEKELLHEQVCRLVDRAQTRANAHRDSTLQVAQHVNQYQSKIKDTTRKTMALVSELTMQQANTLRLKHEVHEREAAVDRAYLRLQAGQSPDEAIEQQWQQLLREEQQKEASLKKLSREVEETVSTAEPRPNAYLPSGEGDLPLPKPYGSHAPFKPSQAGANMRHIRKPEPKSIDI